MVGERYPLDSWTDVDSSSWKERRSPDSTERRKIKRTTLSKLVSSGKEVTLVTDDGDVLAKGPVNHVAGGEKRPMGFYVGDYQIVLDHLPSDGVRDDVITMKPGYNPLKGKSNQGGRL